MLTFTLQGKIGLKKLVKIRMNISDIFYTLREHKCDQTIFLAGESSFYVLPAGQANKNTANVAWCGRPQTSNGKVGKLRYKSQHNHKAHIRSVTICHPSLSHRAIVEIK